MKRGFTLIELLVVIAIIGLLASIILVILNSARQKGRVSKVQADLSQLYTAMEFLYDDTGEYSAHCPSLPCNCSTGPEIYLDTSAAGLQSTDGAFPGWNGPYITAVPEDPWGNRYIFDTDYNCSSGVTGCQGISATVRAIHSGGSNGSGINQYDNDNIVLILCR